MLALDKAATRRRRQVLESSITAKRLRASHPLRETHLIVQKLKFEVAEHGMKRSMSLVDAWSLLERVKRRFRPA
jgi:hypothetical protein